MQFLSLCFKKEGSSHDYDLTSIQLTDAAVEIYSHNISTI